MIITIEARLQQKSNEDLLDYFASWMGEYNSIVRYVWKILNGPSSELTKKRNKLNTHLQQKFRISKRTAGSIIFDMQGRRKSFRELKQYEIRQLKTNIAKLESQKAKQKSVIDALRSKCIDGSISPKALKTYKSKRTKYYYLTQRLNKKKQQLEHRKDALKTGKFSMCFGTKRLWRSQHCLKENGFKSHLGWKNAFIKNRDKNLFYLGSKDESFGNQMFQLSYNPEADNFNIKVRKTAKRDKESKYVEGRCNFKYKHEELKAILLRHTQDDKDGWQALTYRVKRCGTKWYLQVIFDESPQDHPILTRKGEGVIGIDFNESFLITCETNGHGHIVRLNRHDLPTHKDSNTSQGLMREVVAHITQDALLRGKDIAIEDLDFSRSKGKMVSARSKSGKRYNCMLSSLDYSRFKTAMTSSCFHRGVGLTLVPPAYSSKNGKNLYCDSMKLSVHQAASFVIAHRGHGLKD